VRAIAGLLRLGGRHDRLTRPHRLAPLRAAGADRLSAEAQTPPRWERDRSMDTDDAPLSVAGARS
jgi:hypothetical protein